MEGCVCGGRVERNMGGWGRGGEGRSTGGGRMGEECVCVGGGGGGEGCQVERSCTR